MGGGGGEDRPPGAYSTTCQHAPAPSGLSTRGCTAGRGAGQGEEDLERLEVGDGAREEGGGTRFDGRDDRVLRGAEVRGARAPLRRGPRGGGADGGGAEAPAGLSEGDEVCALLGR
jgi:hypothetical protein